VHRYASEYFRLPTNHIAVIKDAVAFVDEAGKVDTERSKYDYIIHDVFTGGAEPAALFTLEFLKGSSLLLKADGVIAIVSRHFTARADTGTLIFGRTTLATCCFHPPRSLSTPLDLSSPVAGCSVKKLYLTRRIQPKTSPIWSCSAERQKGRSCFGPLLRQISWVVERADVTCCQSMRSKMATSIALIRWKSQKF